MLPIPSVENIVCFQMLVWCFKIFLQHGGKTASGASKEKKGAEATEVNYGYKL